MVERPIPVRLFRPVEWVADAERSACIICSTNFTLTNRRHHCRLCGEVVCGVCSSFKVFIRNEESLERACKTCYTLAQNSYKSLAAKKTGADPNTAANKASPPPVMSHTPEKRKPEHLRLKSYHRTALIIFLATLAATALQYDWIGWTEAGLLGVVCMCVVQLSSLVVMFVLRHRKAKKHHHHHHKAPERTPSEGSVSIPEPAPVSSARRVPFKGVYGPVPRCEQYEAKIQGAIDVLLDCSAAREGQDGWTKVGSKSGVEIFSKPSNGDANFYMGRGIVEAPPRAILDILVSERVETTRELDEFFDRGETLEQFDFHTSVVWNLYKPVMFVAARDFLMLSHQRVLDDGSLVYVAQSLPDHPKCPRMSSVVRGMLFVGGWHITPLPGNRSNVTYVTNASLGGSVPSWLINKISQSQPMQVAGIAKMMKQRNLSFYLPGGSRHELKNGIDLSCPQDVERSLVRGV